MFFGQGSAVPGTSVGGASPRRLQRSVPPQKTQRHPERPVAPRTALPQGTVPSTRAGNFLWEARPRGDCDPPKGDRAPSTGAGIFCGRRVPAATAALPQGTVPLTVAGNFLWEARPRGDYSGRCHPRKRSAIPNAPSRRGRPSHRGLCPRPEPGIFCGRRVPAATAALPKGTVPPRPEPGFFVGGASPRRHFQMPRNFQPARRSLPSWPNNKRVLPNTKGACR